MGLVGGPEVDMAITAVGTDVGLTVGLNVGEAVKMEVGLVVE